MKQAIRTVIVIFALSCVFPAQIIRRERLAPDKSNDARKLVRRAMKRFGETLDFRDVYQLAFIQDPGARRRLFASEYEDDEAEKRILPSLSVASQERAYIASQRLFWLYWIFFFREDQKGDFTSSHTPNVEQFNNRYVVPHLNRRQKALFTQRSKDGGKRHPLSAAEFDDFTAIYNISAAILRRHFNKKLREQVRAAVVSTASDVISSDPHRPSYLVTVTIGGMWGTFHFTVVEEAGVLRISHVWIADGQG
jgi:hypothetical protein